MEKILLPVDDSEESWRAVHYAIEVALNTGASLELVHIVPADLPVVSDVFCPNLDEIEKMWEEHGRDLLDKMIGTRHDHVQVTSRLEKGETSQTILELARRGRYNLIVMGTKGLSWLKRAIYGHSSVCSEVVAHAPCPVLVVH